MNTVMDTTGIDTVPDGLTVSMVEVDAAAARGALADRLQLTAVDLENPAVVAVVAAGWRPPTPPGDTHVVTVPADDGDTPVLFGDDRGVDSARIGVGRSGPPGWSR
jgi:hypothetical protein